MKVPPSVRSPLYPFDPELSVRYLQQLEDVEANIKVGELGVQDLEVSVVDALEN